MDQVEGKIYKLAKIEKDQYFPIQTKQASSISFYRWYASVFYYL